MSETADALTLLERIDAWLPQTQCTRCGFPHCRAYAEAIAAGAADINRCPPGAQATIAGLAALLGVASRPLDAACGATAPRQRARIDEARCIGCRKCLDACPVDAIVGARRMLHTVIAADCTGCGLCLPPCPVDCIALLPAAAAGTPGPWPQYGADEAARWRRLAARRRARRTVPGDRHRAAVERERIRAEIRAAVERVRARRAMRAGAPGTER